MKSHVFHRVCENPSCRRPFETVYNVQRFCCADCREAMKRSTQYQDVVDAPAQEQRGTNGLDLMTPEDLLHYGKIQAQKTLEELKRKEKRGKEK